MSNAAMFDAYEVSPVVESDVDGMGGMQCEAFPTIADAEAALASAKAEGIDARILWTVYGHTTGAGVEAIADFPDEAAAFGLLFKISGQTGTTGTVRYPLPQVTIAVWTCTSDTRDGMQTSVHTTEEDAYGEMAERWRSTVSTEFAATLTTTDPEEIEEFVQANLCDLDSYSVELHCLHSPFGAFQP